VSADRQQFLAFVLAALAVIAAAFGAHLLREQISEEAQGWWQTAVRMHFWHAVGLWISGAQTRAGHRSYWAGAGFLLGTFLFSGSLYLLAVTDWRALGAVTPVGGVLLVAGWVALAAGALRR